MGYGIKKSVAFNTPAPLIERYFLTATELASNYVTANLVPLCWAMLFLCVVLFWKKKTFLEFTKSVSESFILFYLQGILENLITGHYNRKIRTWLPLKVFALSLPVHFGSTNVCHAPWYGSFVGICYGLRLEQVS